jgi:hypothetical protein
VACASNGNTALAPKSAAEIVRIEFFLVVNHPASVTTPEQLAGRSEWLRVR